MAKKSSLTANVIADIWDGEFSLNFECVGTRLCRFALCPIMPPDGTEECVAKEYGACRSPQAQFAAIEALINNLKKELKHRLSEGEY